MYHFSPKEGSMVLRHAYKELRDSWKVPVKNLTHAFGGNLIVVEISAGLKTDGKRVLGAQIVEVVP